MASFFFYSEYGDAFFLAWKLKQEGHSVRFSTFDKDEKNIGLGYVERGLAPKSGDVVIFDSTGKGDIGRKLRSQGFKVIGGNPFDKILEEDRTAGAKIMERRGISIPDTKTFTTLPEAIAYLEKQEENGSWFFKPSGHGISTALTHSSSDPAELVRFLRWAEDKLTDVKSFEIQKGVVGLEISTEGWFDGKRFVHPFNSTFEDKKLLTGDLGPRTGCQANVVWNWEDQNALLPEVTVARITQDLKTAGYVGPVDLNAIIDDDTGEVWGLEWTARTGYDAFFAWTLLLSTRLMNVGEQLEAFANGDLDQWYFKRGEMGLTLRITMPPYPMSGPGPEDLDPLGQPLDSRLMEHEHFMPFGIMKGKDGLPALGTNDGVVGVVGITGTDMEQMRREALKHAGDYDIPSAMYRTDPVKRAESGWLRLTELGYMKKPKRAA